MHTDTQSCDFNLQKIFFVLGASNHSHLDNHTKMTFSECIPMQV